MRIARREYESVLAESRRGHPLEVCGVLLGRAAAAAELRVEAVRPMANREAESPHTSYVIAPEDLLAAQRQARARGLDIVGYYHSHPDHPARPSETDRRIAAEGLSDGVVHVVVSVDAQGRTEATAWVFRDAAQAFEPVPLEVDPAAAPREAAEGAWP
jgi:proteasome lid subunit RPN8/RPN11